MLPCVISVTRHGVTCRNRSFVCMRICFRFVLVPEVDRAVCVLIYGSPFYVMGKNILVRYFTSNRPELPATIPSRTNPGNQPRSPCQPSPRQRERDTP